MTINESFFQELKKSAPSILLKNYKPILGSLAGAYILGKILLPDNLHEYLSWKKQAEGMKTQEELLSMIAASNVKPIQPKKDNYFYSF
jgi:hypothetical protein